MKKKLISACVLLSALYMASCDSKTTSSDTKGDSIITSVKPIDKGNGIFAFEFNGLYFETDASHAGRISAFGLNGKNFLTGKDVNPVNWGTSLWPSPQSAWGWPPSKQLDGLPYIGGIKDSLFIELTSQKDSLLGYVFKKEYKANPADSSVTITYTAINDSEKKQSLSLWEITRVAPGGLTIYPSGKTKKKGLLEPLTKDSLGITWFKYVTEKIPSGDVVPKLLSDGSEGWMAQVNNGIILIKKFSDVPVEKTAPEEGEIELYANPDKSYIEIEQQGEYTALEPGKSLSWEIKWYLKTLPSGIDGTNANQALVDYIRKTVK